MKFSVNSSLAISLMVEVLIDIISRKLLLVFMAGIRKENARLTAINLKKKKNILKKVSVVDLKYEGIQRTVSLRRLFLK